MPRPRTAERNRVSSSQLASMVICERRVLLAELYGARSTPTQQASRLRGIAGHTHIAHADHVDRASGRTGEAEDDRGLCRWVTSVVLTALRRLLLWRGRAR